jgi:hypothetical protein
MLFWLPKQCKKERKLNFVSTSPPNRLAQLFGFAQ